MAKHCDLVLPRWGCVENLYQELFFIFAYKLEHVNY